MDRIVFKPGDVRGGGNIISPPKILTDFQRYNAELSLSSTLIDNQPVNVFTETYLPGSYFTVEYNEWIPVTSTRFTVSVVLKDNTDTVITGATVTCTVNNETVLTATTDNTGSASFTISCSDYYVYSCRLYYEGTSSVAGCIRNVVVHLGNIEYVELMSEVNTIRINDTGWLLATVTGRDGDGEVIPASYYPVRFYELYRPGIQLYTDKRVCSIDDTVEFTSQFIDLDDDSRVRLADETVQFFKYFERDHINMPELPIITPDEVAVLSATVFDKNNGRVQDVPVFFEEEVPGEYSITNVSCQNVLPGEVTSISATVTGDNVEGLFVRFYADEEEDREVIIPDSRPLPTLTLTGPETVGTGSVYTISGVLGNVTSATNKQIKLYENNVLVDTLLCDSGGNFSKSFSKSDAGVFTYPAVKEATGIYQRAESNRVNVTVESAVVPDSISISSDVNALSAYDADSAILTATVLDDSDNPLAGQTVTMKAYQGSSLVDTLAVTDNLDGTYTGVYDSTGVGDVDIVAECSSLSDTCSIEDCLIYSAAEKTFTSTGTVVSSAMYEDIFDVANTDFEMTYDIKTAGSSGGLNIGANTQYTPPSTANYRIFIGGDGTNASFNNRTNSSSNSMSTMSHNVYHTLKLTKESTTVKGYVDDTLIATKTISWLGNYSKYDLYWINWGSTNAMKNLKIKPL